MFNQVIVVKFASYVFKASVVPELRIRQIVPPCKKKIKHYAIGSDTAWNPGETPKVVGTAFLYSWP
jgi:hypothetical protein